MKRIYEDYYYKRRSKVTLRQLFASLGFVVFVSGGVIFGAKILGKNNTNEAPKTEEPSVMVGLPINNGNSEVDAIAEIGPAEVIEKYRSLLSYELRYNLDEYLNQDSSRSCEDLEAKGITTTDHLRLRKGPGTDYEIITELEEDTYLEVLAVCDNDWYLVRNNHQMGFVSGDYLRVLLPDYVDSQIIEPSLHVLRGIRSKASLNVRDGANDKTAQIIGSLDIGQIFVVERRLENGWYEIQYGDRKGYVCGDYVEEIYASSLEELPIIYIRDNTEISEKPYEPGYATMQAGQYVRIYGENDDYYLIQNNGNYGYVPKSDCERMSEYYAIISLSQNTITVYHLGEVCYTARESNGAPDTPTPQGCFTIYSKLDSTRMSGNGYSNVKVDLVLYYMNGCAVHVGDVNVLSHGCNHVERTDMEKIYTLMNVGDRLFVIG